MTSIWHEVIVNAALKGCEVDAKSTLDFDAGERRRVVGLQEEGCLTPESPLQDQGC